MGKRYTKEEISQIQALVEEGFTDKEIAEKLNRTENAIRNIGNRIRLKTQTKESIESLIHEQRTLNKKVQELKLELSSLQTRKEQVSKALQIKKQFLNQRLHNALTKLKDQKPELFYITAEEQLAKLAVQLTGSFLRWLIE